MLVAVLCILSGLVLSAPALKALPTVGAPLARAGRALGTWRVVLGVVAIVVGALHVLSLVGVALVAAGLVLAIEALPRRGKVGRGVRRLGSALEAFATAIGIFALVVGILALI